MNPQSPSGGEVSGVGRVCCPRRVPILFLDTPTQSRSPKGISAWHRMHTSLYVSEGVPF